MALSSKKSPLQPQLPNINPNSKDIVYFDLETQNSFDDVGGRQNLHKLKLSVAITFSSASSQFRAYTEEQVHDLLDELKGAGLVVGFNVREFDYKVLQPYADFRVSQVKTLDIMDHVVRHLGFRLSLDALASATLGEHKSADGLQAIRWFREGQIQQIIAYCQKDVEIVRKLHEFGAREGCLFYRDRSGRKQRLPVSWPIAP